MTKAEKLRTDDTRTLDEILDAVPDFWTDPDLPPGPRAPKCAELSWRIFCRGGSASGLPTEIGLKKHELRRNEDLEARAEALRDHQNQENYAAANTGARKTIADLERVLEAVGGWANAGMAVLTSAVGQAEFELTEARNMAVRYNHPGIEVPETVLRRVRKAEAALAEAQTARAEMLEVVDADRAELAKLHARRIA